MDRSTIEILLNNLDKISKHSGLSQTEIARRCGLAQKTVNNLFRSISSDISPKIDTIDKIAKTFNLTAAELLSPDMTIADSAKDIKLNAVPGALGALIEDFLRLDEMGQAVVVSTTKRESKRRQQSIDARTRFSNEEQRWKSGMRDD
jgi:transcriptional regulator with XRE-family HTH domain